MPTIIDALVVELGFDTAGIDAGRKKVEDAFKKTQESANKTDKEIDKAAQRSNQYLTRLRNNVLALYAAFTAGRGIKEFVKDMTEGDAALGRFAKVTGQSAESIAAWRGAGRLMGVDAKDIDSTFSTLAQQFQQFSLTGDSTLVPWFRALGMSMSDTSGKMRPVNDLLLEMAQRFQGMDPTKAAAIAQNMGISPGMINLLLQGPPAIQRLIDKQRELAKVQAADTEAAARRQLAWESFISQAERVGIILLTALTPALEAVANGMEAVARWAGDNPNAAGAVFAALTAVTLALSAALAVNLVGTGIAAAVAGFTALSGLAAGLVLRMALLTATALPALGDAFLALAAAIELTPVGWIISGIALIGAAGYLLIKNWDHVKAWWHSLWSWMAGDAEDGADKITGAADRVSKGSPGAPRAKAAGSGGAAITGKAPGYGARGGPTTDQDVKTLMAFGWTREQATGIVANVQAESGGRTDATGDSGNAFGLGQWHADRQARFKAWAGKDIHQSSRAEQLAFINYELRNQERGAGDRLSATRDEGSAARVVSKFYERPDDAAGQSDTRAAIAQAMARAPSNAAVSPQRVAASTATTNHHISNSTTDVRIGTQNIHTQSTDAKGIARDITPALQGSFAQQANSGPV